MLPYRERLIHVRWSGEACWIPLGGLDLGLGYENATSYPVPGQLLFHPGGISETEILLAYGSVRFGSKVGQLAGNHFLTIVEGAEHLPELGRLTLWQGAQTIEFTLVYSGALAAIMGVIRCRPPVVGYLRRRMTLTTVQAVRQTDTLAGRPVLCGGNPLERTSLICCDHSMLSATSQREEQ